MITKRLRRIECDSARSEGTAKAGGWRFKEFILSVWLLLCFIAPACQPIETVEAESAEMAIDSTATQFLLYPQQGLLELWSVSTGSPNILLDSFTLQTPINFPIGIYPIQIGKNGPELSYPNAFYREKLGKKALKQQLSFEKWREKFPRLRAWEAQSEGKRVLVMAEEACFACPHWMAEVYGLLEAAQ